MSRLPSGRAVVVLAAGMLFLDGILLVLGGIWTDRLGLIALGIVMLAGGCGVIWLWRRWRRALLGIDEARKALKRERQVLASLLEQTHHRR